MSAARGVTCRATSVAVGLEAAGREHHRDAGRQFGQRLSDAHVVSRGAQQSLGQVARVEAGAAGERVARLPLDGPRAQRLDPLEAGVEPLEHRALERLVAAGALLPEARELTMAPDHAARQQHRAAGAVALLQHEHARAALRGLDGRAQPGHARARDDQVVPGARRVRSQACARRTRA